MSMNGQYRQIAPALAMALLNGDARVEEVVDAPHSSSAGAIGNARKAMTRGLFKAIGMVSPDTAAMLGGDQEEAETLPAAAYPIVQSELGESLDLNKDWHGVHFALTGESEQVDGPLGAAVLGGQEIGPDLGFGPARLLQPDAVAEIAEVLEKIVDPEQRFDALRMDAAGVYPGSWQRPEARQGVAGAFAALRAFYRRAADRGWAVLTWLD